MKTLALAAVLAAAHTGVALAAGSGVTLVGPDNQYIGTADNPLNVTGGGGGGGGGTVAQGTPAAVANAWPFFLTQGGAVLSGSNPLPIAGPVSQSGTWTVAATQSGSWTISLGSGTNIIGSVNQGTSPWVVSGTVTANLGTLNGAATAAGQANTAPGTSATSAQGVQGVTGGVPVPIQGGNATAVKTDGSAVTQPISAAALPLPAGAATASNQAATQSAPGTSATNADTIQGSASGVPVPTSCTAGNCTVTANQGSAVNNIAWGTTTNVVGVAGGVSNFSRIVSSAATTNATSAKGSAGRIYKIYGCNTTTTTPVYIRFYNLASAPTVGTSAVAFSRVFPASASAGVPNCASYDENNSGWFLSTGIAYAMTTGNADTDTTALTAGQITQLSIEYQ